ncbi:MAG TPA: hypothetical protein VHM25_02295 [Polyangiaceae bacterium]|nr:hypothetical protein [Polyangiaceae bacterium]
MRLLRRSAAIVSTDVRLNASKKLASANTSVSVCTACSARTTRGRDGDIDGAATLVLAPVNARSAG